MNGVSNVKDINFFLEHNVICLRGKCLPERAAERRHFGRLKKEPALWLILFKPCLDRKVVAGPISQQVDPSRHLLPQPVEAALRTHPAVADCAVFGLADSER